jgi:broad specificity phosphatase PhoE
MATHQYVYLARHGETDANVLGVVQGLDDPLTERGHRQAARLAGRAQNLEFDHLLSSDAQRALDTARHVAEAAKKVIESDACLREVRRPSSLIGVPWTDERYLAFRTEEHTNQTNPDWRYEDSENFSDVRDRARATLQLFESYETAPLFVVSHGLFMRAVAATVLLERSLTREAWWSMHRALPIHNTGITVLRRDLENAHWVLLSWNDHSHFADE